ncbi:MAG: helix-turn-helix transcriptional regulator [Candidatus Hydrogenedentes bacterium]|nr:helix-turn-helix transcriptional regulator [Candidatus Hydrogenedentota bacterium]
MSNLNALLGRRLRELRGDTPQVQFASKLGISKSSLNRIEMGDQNVSLKTIEVICAKLGCSIADLFS